MGDENTVLLDDDARHLVRRTGFGATAGDIAHFSGMTRGEAADELLSYRPTAFRPNAARNDRDHAHNKWLKYMVRSRSPLQEKLVLFWHDHFATNVSKVQDVTAMANQNRLLRLNAKGNMKTLVKAINKDAAMMRFLDTVDNDLDIPNENYGRELQELFTLGVLDSAGSPNYTQADVAMIARAFTGWRSDDRGNAFLRDSEHDTQYPPNYPGPDRGDKIIYKSTGGFGAAGRAYANSSSLPEGEAEIDRVIDIIFDHTDTNGQNTVARRTTRRLLEYFAHPNPSLADIDTIIATSGFDSSFELQPLLRAIFTHDTFYATAAPAPFTASTQKSVKWPIDFVVGTLKNLDMKLKGRDQFVNGGDFARALDYLRNMGQEVLDPPSVFGWDWETSWVSSAALLARYAFVRNLTSARDGAGATVFDPAGLGIDMGGTNGAIVDQVTDILGVTNQLTSSERTILVNYLGSHGSVDDDVVRGLFVLVLQSPAYQVH